MANDAEGALGLQIANPQALGFGALAIPFWMYAMINAGWFPEAFGTDAALDAAILSTYALLVAALASFLRGETWHAVFFMFWAAFGWAVTVQTGEASPDAFRGWFTLTVVVFNLLLAWGAFRDRELGTDRALVALGASLWFLGSALSSWGLASVFGMIGGYIGLLTALLAFWIVFQIVLHTWNSVT